MERNGAGLFLSDGYILPGISNFQLNFTNNFAFVRGGAIYIDLSTNSNITKCNWLLQIETNQLCNQSDIEIGDGCPVIDGEFLCRDIAPQPTNDSDVCNFCFSQSNASMAGNIIFYQAPELTNTENASSIFFPQSDACGGGFNDTRDISTQPVQLRLFKPAKCDDTGCSITNITLGEVIHIPAQVVGYNNESAESTVFLVTCIENCTNNYVINGTNPVLINEKFRGIVLTGVQHGPSLKLLLMSTTIRLHLLVELVPCRSGYTYKNKACECYTTDGIVSCKPQTTIRRDYWFGMVDNTTTVSRCPYTYCNFSREEVSPGRFLLPSVQDDQCDSHRAGPACGSCDDGYTIPFDSAECISMLIIVILGIQSW